jgi:hypothetical protein
MPESRHQLEFQRTRSAFTLLAAGWGAGKSYAGLLFIEWSLAMNPGALGIIIEPDYKKVRDFINNKFRVAFRDYIIGESVQDSIIFMKGGRRVLYMSGHKLEAMEQYQAAWLFADEVGLMKSALMPRAAARTRDTQRPPTLRRIGFAGTPHWGWLADTFDGRDDLSRRIIHASSFDNPRMDNRALQVMLESTPASLAEAYVFGHFTPPGGAIYGELESKTHLIEWTYKPHLETGVSIDWGSRNPHVLFFQLIPKGYKLSNGIVTEHQSAVVFDEIILDGRVTRIRTDDLCDAITDRKYNLTRACVDPTGYAQIEISAARLGVPINFIRKSKRVKVTVGIEHVSRMLRPFAGKPLLFFASKLAGTDNPRSVWNGMKAYSFKEDKDGEPLSEEPDQKKAAEHATSCVRYIAINYFPLVRYKGA